MKNSNKSTLNKTVNALMIWACVAILVIVALASKIESDWIQVFFVFFIAIGFGIVRNCFILIRSSSGFDDKVAMLKDLTESTKEPIPKYLYSHLKGQIEMQDSHFNRFKESVLVRVMGIEENHKLIHERLAEMENNLTYLKQRLSRKYPVPKPESGQTTDRPLPEFTD